MHSPKPRIPPTLYAPDRRQHHSDPGQPDQGIKALPYDTLRDLTPIAYVGDSPLLLVVHPAVPANSLAELIAYVKANPGKLSYGSAGTGTGNHLAGEWL